MPQRAFRRTPAYIGDKLLAWVALVERQGLEETRKVPGYHDEPLRGPRAGQRSIRLSRAYRAVYTLRRDLTGDVAVIEEVTKQRGEGATLATFAARLGETKQHLSDIEHGRRGVSVERAAAWAKALGYHAGQFVELAIQAQLHAARLPFVVTVTGRRGGRAA